MSAQNSQIHREATTKKTKKGFEQKNIQIVLITKADNLPNVPQTWSIENFWALLARATYAKGEAKNEAVKSKGS
jgi:hypothetical protein